MAVSAGMLGQLLAEEQLTTALLEQQNLLLRLLLQERVKPPPPPPPEVLTKVVVAIKVVQGNGEYKDIEATFCVKPAPESVVVRDALSAIEEIFPGTRLVRMMREQDRLFIQRNVHPDDCERVFDTVPDAMRAFERTWIDQPWIRPRGHHSYPRRAREEYAEEFEREAGGKGPAGE